MFQIRVAHGIVLKDAVSVISKLTDRAMVYVNDEGFSILVRHEENKYGKLIVVLRLRKTGCPYYHFHSPVADVIGVSLVRFQEILNFVTELDSVSISRDGDGRNYLVVDLDDSDPGGKRNFAWQILPYNAQEYPYNAIIVNFDETPFRVTASIPSTRFCEVLAGLRYNRGPDNVLTDTLEPVVIFMTMDLFTCQSSGRVVLLKEEDGLTIEGATEEDAFKLEFPLVQLNAFMEAAPLSDRVFVHAHENRFRPLLNCPFGQDLGSLFFIGSSSFNIAE